MLTRKVLFWWGKCAVGGGIAFILLTGFCFFYFNMPIRYPNPYGTTDFSWNPDTLYMQCKEGFGYGQTNNEGFNNSIDYKEKMPIDVLLMGSSQVRGYEVGWKKTMTERLGALMPEKTIYNIGMSSHEFLRCCCNLEAALDRYAPANAVVMETDRIQFTSDELLEAIDETIPKMEGSFPWLLVLMERNQLIRTVKKQLEDILEQSDQKEGLKDAENGTLKFQGYEEELDRLFGKIALVGEQKGTPVIIFYHPSIEISQNGAMIFGTDPKALEIFRDGCERYGITFVDMTGSFLQKYEQDHMLPYGFINTRVGRGHLNAVGHDLVAKELYYTIQSMQ